MEIYGIKNEKGNFDLIDAEGQRVTRLSSHYPLVWPEGGTPFSAYHYHSNGIELDKWEFKKLNIEVLEF